MKTTPSILFESALGAGAREMRRLIAADPDLERLIACSHVRVACEVRPFCPHRHNSTRGPAIGYLSFTIDAGRVLTIQRAFVLPSHRRKGIASEMVRKIERKANLVAVRAIVVEDDLDSIRWCQSLGMAGVALGPAIEFKRLGMYDAGARVIDSILAGDGRVVRE